MPPRAARWILRLAGWLMTPLLLVCAAAIGATLGLLVSPVLSPTAAMVTTLVLALAAAIVALVYWVRMLRAHPGLRRALVVTTEGLPESDTLERLIHPETDV